MFEDDGKETSSDEMNTSREDLTCVWSDEEDDNGNGGLVTRVGVERGREDQAATMRPMSIVSSEEGEVSEYPTTTSHISTLESNPDIHRKHTKV